jgi:hypothetical protein
MALTKVIGEGVQGISNASDATAIAIDSSENVAIGSTDPQGFQLQVNLGSAGNIARFTDGTNANAVIKTSGSTTTFGPDTTNTLIFQTNDTERMRMDTAGHFFFGTTTNHNASEINIDFTSASECGMGINDTNSGNLGPFIAFLTGGTFRGSIVNNNNTAVAYNTTSDYRLKENVSYDFDATARLKQLKPARFNWIADDTNTSQDGFLAHEVSNIVPEAITGTKDETRTTKNVVLDKNENIIANNITEDEWKSAKTDGTFDNTTTWKATITQKHYQQIDHSKLVPLLVKTIQELEARIAKLEGS